MSFNHNVPTIAVGMKPPQEQPNQSDTSASKMEDENNNNNNSNPGKPTDNSNMNANCAHSQITLTSELSSSDEIAHKFR